MEDFNISNDLKQLSHGQVKTLEYSHYDINRYHFRTVKLEASHPLVATINSRVITGGKDATGHITDYYDILQNYC
jgi:methenyltetrahydromethanopterin cyclohydrolase